MVTPFQTVMQMQIAFYQGWLRLLDDNMLICQRLWTEQAKLLEHSAAYRLQDIAPIGADWFDHYGKRAHDVNVERV